MIQYLFLLFVFLPFLSLFIPSFFSFVSFIFNIPLTFSFLSWRASNYSFLWGLTLSDGIKYRLGTFYPAEKVFRMQSLHPQQDEGLPEYFDARQKWPGMITDIQDQRDCGSSWAFSSIGKLPCE